MGLKSTFRDNRKERVQVPDLYDYPIHKKLNDFKYYSEDILKAIKDWFKLEISLNSLVKLQRSLSDAPTPFELKVIDSYWACGKGHYNRKISEIQIGSDNPHLFKALDLYDSLRKHSNSEMEPRTLKDVFKMGFVAQRLNGLHNIFENDSKVQMECSGYDKGIRGNYCLSLNTIWAKTGVEASNKAIKNTISCGNVPIGAIYKEYAGGSYHNRLKFAKYIDSLGIPTYECPSCDSSTLGESVVKVSMLGYADRRRLNEYQAVGGDKILLIKPLKRSNSIVDFYSIAQNAFAGVPFKILNTSDGIVNSLIDSVEGFDIEVSDVNLGDVRFEDYVLNEIDDSLLVIIKKKYIFDFKKLLKVHDFDCFIIGTVNKEKHYRLLNECVELMRLSSDIVKYHQHDYSIFRIEDNVVDSYRQLYQNFDENLVSDYIRKNLALGRFNPNSFISGVSSGLSLRTPLLGARQLTPMHALQLIPSVDKFENSCAMITSNVNTQVGNNDFSITVNSVVSALMKLVVLGVPLCDTAISCNLLYDVKGNRLVRGAVLAKSLACLYVQNALSVGSMGNSIELMRDKNSNGIVSDITAIGFCSADVSLSNLFKKGDKLYYFSIPRDEYDIPDFSYVLKLCSQINMNINIGHVTAGRVIEFNVVDSIMKGTAGDGLGFSFAKVDEAMFEKTAGGLLLAIDDEWDVDFFGAKYIGVVDDTGVIKGTNSLITQEEIERIVYKFPFENNPYFRIPKVEKRSQELPKPISKILEINALVIHTDDSAERNISYLLNKLGYKVRSVKLPEYGNVTNTFAIKLREEITKSNLIICSGRSNFDDIHDGFFNALHNPIVLDALNDLIFNHDGLVLCNGEGARVFLELGYLACGNAEMGKPINLELKENSEIEKSAKLPKIKITNNHSPFLTNVDIGATYLASNAGSKFKFVFTDEVRRVLNATGQIAMQFVDYLGYPTIVYPDNPYGSQRGVAGLSSPDGRILGLFVQPELNARLLNENSLMEDMLISAKQYFNKE